MTSSLMTAEFSALEWMRDVTARTSLLMERFKKKDEQGAFYYSLSGDIPQGRWGLGNTCFASKIYKTLGILKSIDSRAAGKFILSFQDSRGAIFDPEIKRRSRLTRFLRSVKNFDLRYWDYEMTCRAETRQAYAALLNLGLVPTRPFLDIPKNQEEIKKYINSLNWKIPWGAASHFSHLIFFLRHNQRFFGVFQNQADELIAYAFEKLNQFQQSDGSWYVGDSTPLFQKVNAAMKIMLAYETEGRNDFNHSEKLIDLCLAAAQEGHACNHFNVVCVLYHCSRKTSHRKNDIRNYFLERLEKFKTHYYADLGGFSFLPNRANTHYYAAHISRGKVEPDLHGTHLFLWGIVLISEFLGHRGKLKLQIPIT